jgi:hypothetical protein
MTRVTFAMIAFLALGLGTALAAPPAAAQDALDCADFASQAEAQAAYRADPTDPADNDADGDGLACELVEYADPATDLTPVTPAAGGATTTTTTTTAALPTSGSGTALAGQVAGLPGAPVALALLAAAAVSGALALRGLRRTWA